MPSIGPQAAFPRRFVAPGGAASAPKTLRTLNGVAFSSIHLRAVTLGTTLLRFASDVPPDTVTYKTFGDASLNPTVVVEGNRVLFHVPRRLNLLQTKVLVTELTLPASLSVHARFGGGTLVLDGNGCGEVDILGGFGHVRGVTHAPKARVRVAMGSIDLAELVARRGAALAVAFGAVRVRWATSPVCEKNELEERIAPLLGSVGVGFLEAVSGSEDVSCSTPACWHAPFGASLELRRHACRPFFSGKVFAGRTVFSWP